VGSRGREKAAAPPLNTIVVEPPAPPEPRPKRSNEMTSILVGTDNTPILQTQKPSVPNSETLSLPHMLVLGPNASNAPWNNSTSILVEPRPDRRGALSQPALGWGKDLHSSASGNMFQAHLKNSVLLATFLLLR
jgi:hypothetical protein